MMNCEKNNLLLINEKTELVISEALTIRNNPDFLSVLDELNGFVIALGQGDDEWAGKLRRVAGGGFCRVAKVQGFSIRSQMFDLIGDEGLAAMNRRDDDLFGEGTVREAQGLVTHDPGDAEDLVKGRLIFEDEEGGGRVGLELIGNEVAVVSLKRDG